MNTASKRLSRPKVLGGRPLGMVVRNVFQPANYRALLAMPRRYARPTESAQRYFRGTGDYPWRCPIRTPLGVVEPTLWSRHDMYTVNEVFCREDYRAGRDVRVVVDIGSNIGISALYFLTRDAGVRCRLYEPVPRNLERLRSNLAGFDDRYVAVQAAVADTEGELEFGLDASGRYGGLDRGGDTIRVRCLHVATVLEQVLVEEGRVDVLKIDTEGAEPRTVRAIPAELLERVGIVYLEAPRSETPTPPGFDVSARCDTVRMVNRRPRGGQYALR